MRAGSDRKDGHTMKHRDWFWGIFLLVAGIFIIASQFGAFLHVGLWTLVVTVLLAAAFIWSLPELNFFGIFVPLALLYLVYQRPLHLPIMQAWPLLLGTVLLAIGCNVIIPGRFHHRWHGRHCKHGDGDGNASRYAETRENTTGNDVFIRSRFTETSKYLHSDSLKNVDLSSSFGSLRVYFDQARLSPDGADISVMVSCGDMILYFPRGWRVVDDIQVSLGAVNTDTRTDEPDPDAPTVRLTGSVSLGDVKIHFI